MTTHLKPAEPRPATGRQPGRHRRFTLIELLVVIAIIAVLASMLLPALGRARNEARTTKCLNTQRQIALYLTLYCDEYNEAFPNVTSTGWYTTVSLAGWSLFSPTVLDGEGFVPYLRCPSNRTKRLYQRTHYGINYSNSRGIAYLAGQGVGTPQATIYLRECVKPEATFMVIDCNTYPLVRYDTDKDNGINYSYADVSLVHDRGMNVTYIAGNGGLRNNILTIAAGLSEKHPFWARKPLN
jgi:prepilin-type N-terminal cleavage/methylation domain-containing protein